MQEPQRSFQRRYKDVFSRQQADNDEGFVREIEEVARVNEHLLVLEQLEHERFLSAGGRDPDWCGPSTLDAWHRTRGELPRQLPRMVQVRADARVNGAADRRAALEQH